ncbi:nuclear pore complex Nup155 isoform B [Chlorella sorokiniana]|uniref:Nuclear pore complex Nup155 isoform B n=1 Tax=Chlorella sorokiniana TaxID=3076 RepID=A0A2P6TBL5_CHLSO|nr:nuclear pore complex Nup155 isoform B [Chlorella sorokiniana]|eukprot:PRW05942.1 nuclear pore complex Nup155 isoform B [Chlorella sorokiniana]
MAYAPPSAWQDLGPRQAAPSAAPAAAAAAPAELANSWKHIRNVVSTDSRQADLYDLLSHSVRETQYSFTPAGWPSLVRPLSPVLAEMPGMVLERYNACQTVAFCGVFPEIKRAWASVDNSLFLWRFDKWQDVPIEYGGEEQAIVAVGLAHPRPGVFVEAIQHLLVLCTTTEIVLLGVCCSPGPSGSGDACEELTLQPLPLYSVPADNVTMVSVASTADGRIFLGGADGHLYELQYSASDSWRSKRCQKICHTGGLRQLLPSFLPSFLFGSPSALVDICCDDQRHILYTRSQASMLQVFDLGPDGKAAPTKVAESGDFLADAARALGGRDVFGRGGGDRKGAAVVYMAPIPPSQSHRLHLLTVTADGRRVYWAAASSRYGSDPAGPRPDRLRAEVARQAMPSSAASGGVGRIGGAGHAPARGLEVVAAHYSNGVLLLAEAAAGESRTRLFMLSRDLTIPPVGTATGAHVAVAGLREAVSQLEVPTPGEACAIRSVPRPAPLLLGGLLETAVRDELTSQNLGVAPRFVMVTTAGVLEMEKLRPVDVLAQLLEQRDATKLEVFFKSYGPAEAAAICILLATAGPPQASAAVVAQAKAALDNPRLCGEPQLREADGAAAGGAAAAFGVAPAAADDGLAAGFDMGAVVPVSEPEWSGAHHGLCLYASRVLQAVWDEQVVVPMRGSPQLLKCKLSQDALQSLEDKLRALDAFLGDYVQRRRARRPTAAAPGTDAAALAAMPAAKRQRLEDAQQAELKRTEAVRALVARAAQACFLLRVLAEHNLGRMAARLDEPARAQLRGLRFREWVASEDGEALATQLISVLVAEHLSASGGVAEDLAAALQRGCGAYFREDDKLYYQASGLLQRAEAAAAAADREALAREAVSLMLRVPLAVDLAQVVPQLAYLRAVQALVDLPVRKAAAIDPHNVAAQPGPEGEAAAQRRDEVCYSHTMAVMRLLIDRTAATPALEALGKSLSDAERGAFRQQLLARAAAAQDPCFHDALYATLVQLRAVKELLALDTPYLEGYLVRAGGLLGAASGAAVGPLSASQVAHVEVLARFYISRHEYSKAAQVYELLADRASGPGEQAVSLVQREEAYQAAVLQAKSYGDAELLDRLEGKARIVALQQRLADTLAAAVAAEPEGSGAREDAEAAVAELRAAPKPLEVLYNDYAVPSQNWPLCLEMVHLANFGDRPYVCQLWDLALKEAWQQQWESGGSDDDDVRAAAALDEACRCAEALGEHFYPNDNSFPAAHVLMRLEQAAAGSWPVHTGVAQDSGRVLQAMVTACRGSHDAVVLVYEALLSIRGGDEAGDALHAPALRLRLLRSLAAVIAAAKDKLQDRAPGAFGGYRGGRREAGLLAAACEAYAAEARRLLPAAEAERLAAQFEALQAALQPLVGGFRPVAY